MASLPRDTIAHYEYDGKGNINIIMSELVRCKDCKWWGRKDVFKDGSSVIVCKKGRSADPEGFCHYAEMRGEEE